MSILRRAGSACVFGTAACIVLATSSPAVASPHQLLPAASLVMSVMARSAAPAAQIAATPRPKPLPPLYVTFAALQGLDAISTTRALRNGSVEANPFMAPVARHPQAMLAIKVGAAAGTFWAVERLWRHNRAAAVITMVAINAGYAYVVANNLQRARGSAR